MIPQVVASEKGRAQTSDYPYSVRSMAWRVVGFKLCDVILIKELTGK